MIHDFVFKTADDSGMVTAGIRHKLKNRSYGSIFAKHKQNN